MTENACYAIQLQTLEHEEKYKVPEDVDYFNADDDTKFFHYTSVKAAIEMLTSNETKSNESKSNDGKFELWASQQQFLNDHQEMYNGLELISDYFYDNKKDITNRLSIAAGVKKNDLIDKFIKRIEIYKETYQKGNITLDQDIYIVCFCSNGDLLSQWKYYGKDSGVALEYDLKSMYYSGIDAIDKGFRSQRNYLVGPYRVIYCDDKKTQIIERIVNNAIEDYTKNLEDKDRAILDRWEQLFAVAPLFKHEKFQEEEECRLLFRPVFKKDCNTRDIIHYRERNGIPLPYMKITLHPQNNSSCIKSIMIGPGSNQALVYKAFKHLLERKGLDKSILLDYSRTPFRGF